MMSRGQWIERLPRAGRPGAGSWWGAALADGDSGLLPAEARAVRAGVMREAGGGGEREGKGAGQ
jgi:hypothetical protein